MLFLFGIQALPSAHQQWRHSKTLRCSVNLLIWEFGGNRPQKMIALIIKIPTGGPTTNWILYTEYMLLNTEISDHLHVGTVHDRHPGLLIPPTSTVVWQRTISQYKYNGLNYDLSLATDGPVHTQPCCCGSNKQCTQSLIHARLNTEEHAKKVFRSGEWWSGGWLTSTS